MIGECFNTRYFLFRFWGKITLMLPNN